MTDTATATTETAEPSPKLGESPAAELPAKLAEGIDPDTFPREYVEKLRTEAAEARVKAKDRDDIAHRLHTALVAATGRLADPADLPYDPAHLDDPEALTAALDALLAGKPHLASRKPSGNIGQGAAPSPAAFDLLAALRANAR